MCVWLYLNHPSPLEFLHAPALVVMLLFRYFIYNSMGAIDEQAPAGISAVPAEALAWLADTYGFVYSLIAWSQLSVSDIYFPCALYVCGCVCGRAAKGGLA